MSQATEIFKTNRFCVCCLQSYENYIKLSACQHLEYLFQFSVSQLDLQNEIVCYYCHTILKKIQVFSQQITKNFQFLLDKKTGNIDGNQRQNSSIYNLQTHKAIDIAILQESPKSILHKVTNSNTELAPKTSESVYLNKNKADSKMECTKDNHFNKESNSAVDNQRLKNIKNAINIMNLGRNDESSNLNLLATSTISSIASILIGDLSQHVGSSKTTDNLKLNKCEKEVKKENVEKQRPHHISIRQKDPFENKIRAVNLSKEELINERIRSSKTIRFRTSLYKCEKCVLSFNYEENLQDHLDRKHTQKLDGVVCSICEQNVPSTSLQEHNTRHFTRYKCMKCSRLFHLYNEAASHYKLKHKVLKKTCKLCTYSTRSALNFRRHIVNHHFRYPCLLCKQIFKSYFTLKRHRAETHKLVSGSTKMK